VQPVTAIHGVVGSTGSETVRGRISCTASPAPTSQKLKSNRSTKSGVPWGLAPRPTLVFRPPRPRSTQVCEVLQTSPMFGSHAEPQGRTRWLQVSPTGHCAAVTQLFVVVMLQPPVGSSEIWQKAQSAFDVQARSVKTLQRPGAVSRPLGSCQDPTPPDLKSIAIIPKGSDTGSGSTHSSAAM
jgi:hypothetical protein